MPKVRLLLCLQLPNSFNTYLYHNLVFNLFFLLVSNLPVGDFMLRTFFTLDGSELSIFYQVSRDQSITWDQGVSPRTIGQKRQNESDATVGTILFRLNREIKRS